MDNPLKAGRLDNFAASLAEYIDTAMQHEWQAVKGEPLPTSQGSDDRKILFAAIAQGVLKFLLDHRVDLVTTDDSADGNPATTHHHTMAFTVDTYRTPLP